MTMTIETIQALEPLKNQARLNKLRDLSLYVPEDDDNTFSDESYIFFAEQREAKWYDVLNFQNYAQGLLGGNVFVMRPGDMDSVEMVKANTGAVQIMAS